MYSALATDKDVLDAGTGFVRNLSFPENLLSVVVMVVKEMFRVVVVVVRYVVRLVEGLVSMDWWVKLVEPVGYFQ